VDELDEAFTRFSLTAPEWGDGFTNHGPMVCEALVHLGHPALIPACVELLAPRVPRLAEGKELSAAERVSARGDPSRVADWIASYRAELGSGNWREVLRSSVLELAPGLFAAAGHAFLRTAHAARALAAVDNPVRRIELSHGLGYWAAFYETLPGEVGGEADFDAALARLDASSAAPLLREGELLSDSVARLPEHAAYLEAVGGADLVTGDLSDRLSRLCRAVAARYLECREWRIALTHALTIPSAVRILAQVVGEETGEELFPYAWRASAALCAVGVGGTPIPEDTEKRQLAENLPELRYRAACSLEEHAIKLSEACLREIAVRDGGGLRLMAADAALCLGEGARRC
jgi:hypothetical protein